MRPFTRSLSTTQPRRRTNTTALPSPVKKNAMRLPYHAGLCCKPGIAILSALRACESWSIITNPGRSENSMFSLRNSIVSAMMSIPLDVLKRIFGSSQPRWDRGQDIPEVCRSPNGSRRPPEAGLRFVGTRTLKGLWKRVECVCHSFTKNSA